LVSSKIPSFKKSRFSEFLIRENGLDQSGFKEWIFCTGMLFRSPDRWWGDRGMRDKIHEGLDLCLYGDLQNRILSLNRKTKIPAMYDGVVVRMFNDFIGKSVIVEHQLPGFKQGRFCTIYGHTDPVSDLQPGKMVKEGNILATLANAGKSETGILTHLHISVGWTSKIISYDKLDWENIGAPNHLTLLDPLTVMDWNYLVLNHEECEKRNLYVNSLGH
jgi:murein DD-endopeptidase MepM/ murein hydrolase activator NlpD